MLVMPKSEEYYETRFLLVHGIERENDFQIFSYNCGTSRYAYLRKIFELENFKRERVYIEDDYKFKDLMFKNYPIQTELSPFLLANFDTRSLAIKLIEEAEERSGKTKIFHYHNRMDVIANSGFVENEFKSECKINDNFICDIRFPISYEDTIRFRMYYKHFNRQNEIVQFLYNEEVIGTFRPVYIKGTFYTWHQDFELGNEYEKFVFPVQKRIAPYSDEAFLEDDDVSYPIKVTK